MSYSKNRGYGIGVCTAIVGSSTLAVKAQRALASQKIDSSVGKATTASGCVYTITFPCLLKERAERIINSQGINIKGYI